MTKAMRETRLHFAEKYKDWTVEDWKKVVWTDETSVVLGSRRGSVRVWRNPAEKYHPQVIKRRHAGYSEFMFWGSFTYDRKGPCHVWKAETAKEKREATAWIDKINEELEPKMKAEWELNTAMSRTGLRNKPGKKPEWKRNKETGKVVRDGKRGGIDCYRYQKEILLKKLLPFAQECNRIRGLDDIMVQEDKAPSHASKQQRQIFMSAGILRLLWPGKSPGLNMIEPCWIWMKRRCTKKGCPKTKAALTKAFIHIWEKELTQKRIQSWIERMPRHLAKVMELEGGNEYREGRKDNKELDDAVRPYDPVERRQRYLIRMKGIRRCDDGWRGVDERKDEETVWEGGGS